MRRALVRLSELVGFGMSVAAAACCAFALSASAKPLQDKDFFQYFEGRDIDYWQEGKRVQDRLSPRAWREPVERKAGEKPGSGEKSETFSGSTLVRQGDAREFRWERYRDPRSAEFWDDGGDWIPPRPFREAAANPTPENVTQYLAWQGQKTQVVSGFQNALSKFNVAATFDRWSELRIAYFYQSTCSACRSAKDVVEQAKAKGVKFTFVQLDAGANPPLHEPSIPYSEEWKKNFNVEATPTWSLKLGPRTATFTGAVSFDELARQAAALQ